MIRYFLEKLNEITTARVFYVVLDKKKVYSDYLKGDVHKLYNFVAGKLAQNILLQGIDVEIRVDKTKGKQLLREDFNEYFERKLREKSSIHKVTIFHSYSESWSGLQFADVLAWSAFQKVCKNDSSYVDIITLSKDVYQFW